nr:GNAT family N-acetyltransferase [Reinekea sp. G2M2-21]
MNTSDKNRVSLTKQTPEELAGLAQQLLTSDVLMFLPEHWSPLSSLSSARAWLEAQQADIFRITSMDESAGLLIIHKAEAQWHIGFLLLPAFWGQGIATVVVRLVQRLSEREMLKPRLIAGAASENVASIRVLQKCGFEIATSEDGVFAAWPSE